MMDINWTSVAIQIPSVMIIAFLLIRVITFMDGIFEKFKIMSKENSDLVSQLHQSTLTFIEKQGALNHSFIREQQEGINIALARIAEEVKANKSDTIRELSALTQKVDGVLDKSILYDMVNDMKQKSSDKARQRKP